MLLQILLIPREAICYTACYFTSLLNTLKLTTALSFIFTFLDYNSFGTPVCLYE